MKKILITAANHAKAYQLAQFLTKNEIVFADSALQSFIIPNENKLSYAHELLSLCLDNQIDEVYPLKHKEIEALSEAKVLFKEYGIALCTPNLLQLNQLSKLSKLDFDFIAAYEIATSYQELSSKLLGLGYPDQKFVLGKLSDEGALLSLDDSQSNLNNVWTGLNALSFLQLGKLFNHKDFDPIKIYPIENAVLEVDVFVKNDNCLFVQQLEEDVKQVVKDLVKHLSIEGFYAVAIAGNKVLRIKPNTI